MNLISREDCNGVDGGKSADGWQTFMQNPEAANAMVLAGFTADWGNVLLLKVGMLACTFVQSSIDH